MKKQCTILFLFTLFSLNIFAEDIIDDEDNIEQKNDDIKIFDLSGFTLELSCFNYFNIGFGYNWGTCKTFHHFFANDYGFYIEYKTIKELHFRLYYDIYGGAAGMLLGGSGVMATNFDKVTFGIAPHIGIGFPGMKLFYRYNFYLNKEFNCHEIVLTILKNPFDENRRK
jgi:hypothetical protein